MKIRKFFGLTSRSVLEQVRNELGADAVIVANRATADGIEISALPSTAMDTLLDEMPVAPRPRAPQPARIEKRDTRREADEAEVAADSQNASIAAVVEDKATATQVATPVMASPLKPMLSVPVFEAIDEDVPPLADERPVAPPSQRSTAAATETAAIADNGITARLMAEVAAMRSLLEGQMAQLAWGDAVRRQPLRARFTRELIACGYSAGLSREITQHMPDDYTLAQAQQWMMGVLARNIHCIAADDDIVLRGGVYALIGPTGVGKTTTTAKLAARCAVRHGSASLSLLTTDSYRVGAQDQLRIYAKILGVNVQTVSDGQDLRQALDSLSAKHIVLIDTIGMSQRDERVAEQAMLLAQPEVKRLLLLNATAQAETLEEVVRAYGGARGDAERSLAGCIITKQDETARPGNVLDVIIRHKLMLHYVSHGQRVPEDLQAPNAGYLVHRAFKAGPANSPFRLENDELGEAMSAAALGASALESQLAYA